MGAAAHLLIHTITVKSRTGVDAGLTPTYGTASSFAARVERKKKEVADAGGQTKIAEHWVVSETEIKLGDRVWLPGDDTNDDNEAHDPIQVGRASTTSGYVLYEAYL